MDFVVQLVLLTIFLVPILVVALLYKLLTLLHVVEHYSPATQSYAHTVAQRIGLMASDAEGLRGLPGLVPPISVNI